MSEWSAIMAVARWEFLRFLKPRQQLISFCVTIVISALLGGAGYLINESKSKPVTVGLVGIELLGGVAPRVDRLTWTTDTRDEVLLQMQLASKTINGYVVLVPTAVSCSALRRPVPVGQRHRACEAPCEACSDPRRTSTQPGRP